MIVLSESPKQVNSSASAKENKLLTQTAQLLGYKVYYIPPNFEQCCTAENALYHIPQYARETAGIWIGYIPELERYEAIYNAALTKGIKLLNTLLQHQTAMEFDLFYPRLQDLTTEGIVIKSIDECVEAGKILGFPVFIKGAVQSRKIQGWKSCVANTQEELVKLKKWLLTLKYGARGRVIVRKLVNFRHQRLAPNGFPMGREFRVFIYDRQVLKYGYYWDRQDDLSKLAPQEEKEVLNLAVLASKRLGVPYVAIDIGQLDSGEWIVIETGDAQFAGISHIPVLELLYQLKNVTLGG
ncbi:ATP-grasp domain-containing protein [Coleofasciculus sp. FACHB-1120]|uniref:ATP-grasp domain-containing protein n=1 Tax=Coleofasciculus sp. FACHB-1120 TaxID=2692783 RepID=UPI0016874437|nr:ATP-grasp domain-containing protein [Coleofasciculus sp. FACHB-1120]MBD2742142.1 ATP-grasp domain-containing protein [Coleofasciculus sp. FACHB-1120]